ncbi:ras-related protein Rab-17 isoform X1 [Budorcas taxicolor]|uniref:ras-related protein Rab-17 isoform X1 n=1 Tax=Budorcas taxicolor TaxID=37181 RepID=UPI002283A942|nr:ras-related protein Rab-17 isoform X1 [Budorcas taxicolor]
MAQVDGVLRPGAAPGQPCIFKLVLLGSGSVGKSSLAVRYVKNDFKSILPTVGCAFFTKVVDLGAACLKFEIWDTAGQEKYHSVCRLYFRGANAALLVYDITRKDSFCKVQQWLKDLEEEFHPGEVVVMLVGNKTDLGEEREVTFEVQEGANPHLFARKLARSRGLRRCSSSVKRLRAEKVLREGDLPNPGIEPGSPTLEADSLSAEPQGKPENAGVGSLSLLQRIFPTQGLNRDLLHCRKGRSLQRARGCCSWKPRPNRTTRWQRSSTPSPGSFCGEKRARRARGSGETPR